MTEPKPSTAYAIDTSRLWQDEADASGTVGVGGDLRDDNPGLMDRVAALERAFRKALDELGELRLRIERLETAVF